jgi:hypothetical protein
MAWAPCKYTTHLPVSFIFILFLSQPLNFIKKVYLFLAGFSFFLSFCFCRTVELRPFDSDEIRFPNRCWHGFAKCPLGPTRCGFGHAHPRTFASIPGGLDPGGRSKRH